MRLKSACDRCQGWAILIVFAYIWPQHFKRDLSARAGWRLEARGETMVGVMKGQWMRWPFCFPSDDLRGTQRGTFRWFLYGCLSCAFLLSPSVVSPGSLQVVFQKQFASKLLKARWVETLISLCADPARRSITLNSLWICCFGATHNFSVLENVLFQSLTKFPLDQKENRSPAGPSAAPAWNWSQDLLALRKMCKNLVQNGSL